jgi:beta-glucosidase/6-phospho-beta-glucosidase/beta-galactosidase
VSSFRLLAVLGFYVDLETQQRIPKLSAQWFGEAARQNAVV